MVLENRARDMYKKKVLEVEDEIGYDVVDETHFSCAVGDIITHFVWDPISKSYNLIEEDNIHIINREKDGKEKENDRG
jgi:hypothetical protein